jgi:hypothetical protein
MRGKPLPLIVLNEIETNELKFSNEIYQHIIAACKQRMEDNEPLNQDFFINHEDQRISSLASDMLISRYELSARWDEKYLDLEEEALKHLQKDVDSALMRFKLRHVEELLKENNEVMRNAPNEEELIAAMQVHQYLMQIRKELTEKIGTVVVK